MGKYREDGGNFGSIRRGQLSPLLAQFEEAAFSLRNKGEISEVVKTPFGYHIIQLDDKRGTALKPWIRSKRRSGFVLQAKKRQEARTAYVKEAKSKAKITVNEKLWAEEEKKRAESRRRRMKTRETQGREEMKRTDCQHLSAIAVISLLSLGM